MWRRYLTFWGRRIERDLQDELEFHLDARARESIDQGWEPRANWGDTSPVGTLSFNDDRQYLIGADGQAPWFTIVEWSATFALQR